MFFNLWEKKRKNLVIHQNVNTSPGMPGAFADFCMDQLDDYDEEPGADFNKNDTIDFVVKGKGTPSRLRQQAP